ncbi:MAG: hypothetical protein LLG14_16875 [Nocardiaceae bacterium]|nr:hypothetical protein [Nocardiaceae bacterium]
MADKVFDRTASWNRRRLAVLFLAPALVGCSSGPDLGDVGSDEDLSGYTATVAAGDSPYLDLLPSVCKRIPDLFFTSRGMKPPDAISDDSGSLLSLCNAVSANRKDPTGWAVTVGIYADPISFFKSESSLQIVKDNIAVGPDIGTMFRDPEDVTTCRLQWGTFYGSAGVTIYPNMGNTMDPCRDIVEVAAAVHQYLPSRPNEMRPAS